MDGVARQRDLPLTGPPTALGAGDHLSSSLQVGGRPAEILPAATRTAEVQAVETVVTDRQPEEPVSDAAVGEYAVGPKYAPSLHGAATALCDPVDLVERLDDLVLEQLVSRVDREHRGARVRTARDVRQRRQVEGLGLAAAGACGDDRGAEAALATLCAQVLERPRPGSRPTRSAPPGAASIDRMACSSAGDRMSAASTRRTTSSTSMCRRG